MKIIIKASILLIVVVMPSCVPTFTCDNWANGFRDGDEFHLILAKKENGNSRDSYFYGTDLKYKGPTRYIDGGGWIERNFDKFKIGDTLIKDIGKYTIVIKRKGKTILLPFECNGKIYKDK
jgi:hypothetical protein